MGKVIMVARDAAFLQPVVESVYNELGQRIIKNVPGEKGNLVQMTFVTDRKGHGNFINNGRKALQGEERAYNVDWSNITEEFFKGYSPEYSFFSNFHPVIPWIKAWSRYQNAYEDFIKSGKTKASIPVPFGLSGLMLAEYNMQIEMMGSFSASFYKLGDRTLVLINDAKTRESLYYHISGVKNYRREDGWILNDDKSWSYDGSQTNTYQTYLFWH